MEYFQVPPFLHDCSIYLSMFTNKLKTYLFLHYDTLTAIIIHVRLSLRYFLITERSVRLLFGYNITRRI